MWTRGENEALGILIQGNGVLKYRTRCRECQKESTDLPNDVFNKWLAGDQVVWMRKREPNDYPGCSVLRCPEQGTEWHHFAPRNTFTDDADSWPVLPLCRPHHVEWHTRMDGYRWHAKAAVA